MAVSVKDSGGKGKHGYITRKGDSTMRIILGRTSNQFMMHAKGSSVMRYHDSHVDSMGKKKARIATMNKISDIIFAVLNAEPRTYTGESTHYPRHDHDNVSEVFEPHDSLNDEILIRCT